MKNRLIELDALRGVAAISVLFYHYFFRYNELYGHDDINTSWFNIGEYGVQLFFMISGFVIYWTLNRTNSPLDFIVSRFSRLYPVYWFCALLTLLCLNIFGLPGREIGTVNAVGNVLMFHGYFGIPNIDGVYWTLVVELTFYFWIFCFYVTGQLEKAEVIFSAFLIIAILESLNFISLHTQLKNILMLEYINFFLAGICFYKIVNCLHSKWTFLILTLTLLTTITTYTFNLFLLFLSFYIIFYVALTTKTKFLAYKPLLFLGAISYPLYLIHQNIGYIVIYKLTALGFTSYLSILIALTISIVLAYIIHQYLEKNSTIYIKDAYKKYLIKAEMKTNK